MFKWRRRMAMQEDLNGMVWRWFGGVGVSCLGGQQTHHMPSPKERPLGAIEEPLPKTPSIHDSCAPILTPDFVMQAQPRTLQEVLLTVAGTRGRRLGPHGAGGAVLLQLLPVVLHQWAWCGTCLAIAQAACW